MRCFLIGRIATADGFLFAGRRVAEGRRRSSTEGAIKIETSSSKQKRNLVKIPQNLGSIRGKKIGTARDGWATWTPELEKTQ